MNNCSTAHAHPSRNTVTVSTPFQHDQEIPFVIRSQAVKLYHYRAFPHKTLERSGASDSHIEIKRETEPVVFVRQAFTFTQRTVKEELPTYRESAKN